MEIRRAGPSDREKLISWWKEAGEVPPTPGMIPMGSTWIVENEGKPILSVSLFLTNCEIAYVENFIGAPGSVGAMRREATRMLLSYIGKEAKRAGYVKLVCFACNEKLRDYYRKIGFTETLSGLTSFVKEI